LVDCGAALGPIGARASRPLFESAQDARDPRLGAEIGLECRSILICPIWRKFEEARSRMFHFNARSGIVLPVTAVLFAAVAAYGATLDTLSFDQKLRLATAGDEEAQIALARAYESVADVAVANADAADWFRKALD